eukprot:g6499.t1.3.5e17418a g6499  g6499.t1 contig23:610816-615246(-)
MDDLDDIGGDTSSHRNALRKRRNAEMERRRAERKEKQAELERARKARERFERDSAARTAAAAATTNTSYFGEKDGDGNAVATRRTSPPSSPDLFESPPDTPPRAEKISNRRIDGRNNDLTSNNLAKSRYSRDDNKSTKLNATSPIIKNGRYGNSNNEASSPGRVNRVSFSRRNDNTQKKKWSLDDGDSEDDNHDTITATIARKKVASPAVTNDTVAAKKKGNKKPVSKVLSKLGYESSSSSDDDMEALKKKLEEKRIARENSAAAAGAESSLNNNSSNNKHITSASRSSSTPIKPKKPISPTKQPKSRFATLTQLDSSDESDPEKELEQARLALKAKRDAKFKHNPLAIAKREQVEWKERHGATINLASSANVPAMRVRGEGILGKEIVVDDKKKVENKRSGGEKADGENSVSDLGGSQDREQLWQNAGAGAKRKSGDKSLGDSMSSPRSPMGGGDISAGSPAKKPYLSRKDDTEDDLWDDSENEEIKKADDESDSDDGVKKRGRPKKKSDDGDAAAAQRKRSRSKPRTKSSAQASDNDDDEPSSNPKKRALRKTGSGGAAKGRGRPVKRVESKETSEDEASVSGDEEDRLSRDLKPDFANPKLGPPGPLEPYALSKSWHRGDPGDSDEDEKPSANTKPKYQIPASINRYLQGYQRVGSQFMYSSVIQGVGCVLGDDMGLGKTVQVISLVAALLEKTGTGFDKLDLRRHKKKIAKAIDIRATQQREMLMGGVQKKDVVDPLDGITVPNFAPILIVVPSSVIDNWVSEFETWGYFNVGVYRGGNREKAIDDVREGNNFILITGKSLFTRESDYSYFAGIKWKLVIIDEFHEYKNHKSNAFKCLEGVRDSEPFPPLIGLTGTLMQNNHDELFTLIDLVRPGILEDRKSFMDGTSKPIMRARAKGASGETLSLGKQREAELKKALENVYLERRKDVVLKDTLTEKDEKVIFCELSEVQKKLYRRIISLPDYYMLSTANAPCDCGVNQAYFRGYSKLKTQQEKINYQRRHKNEVEPKKKCCYPAPIKDTATGEIDTDAVLWCQKHKVFNPEPEEVETLLGGKYEMCKQCPTCIGLVAMSKLYKVCSHASLLQVDKSLSDSEIHKKLEFAKAAFTPEILREMPGQSYYKSDGIMNDHLNLSGKMKTLDYCLRKYQKKRHRVLVFSYSTATLDLIQQHVKTQGWTHLRLDGQTATSTRQALVDQFQRDQAIFVFLISTRAGGLGLNLTAGEQRAMFCVIDLVGLAFISSDFTLHSKQGYHL